MASFISKLFSAPRSRGTDAQKSARLKRSGRRRTEASLEVQSLEPRLALTIYTAGDAQAGAIVPLTGASGTFAYNIVIDDTVDGSGYGRDAYIQRGSDGTQYFLLDDNPGFSSPKRLGLQNPTYGTCATVFVSSGSAQASSSDVDPAVNSSTYSYTLPSASPLGVSGSVTINGGLSFTYSGSALSFRGGASTDGVTSWTITLINPTAWSTAQYETPTASVTLGGGGTTSTLSFRFTDTVTKGAKAITSASLFNDSYLYFHNQTNPQSFTAFAGQDFTQRLIVDLQPVGSSISINSPWLAASGSASDQAFYSAYDGGYNAGQMSLYATSINVNQTTTTTSRFAAGSTSRRQSGFSTPTLTTTIAAPVNAQNYAIEVTGSVAGATTTHGSLLVAQTGSLVGSGGGAAANLTVTSDWADIRFLGQVNASSQNYLLRAIGSQDQFDFTTRSAATGIATGLVSGSTVAMTLGQPGGGNIDLRTNIANLRFDSGVNASSIPYRYTVAIDEQNALQVDAVAASSGPISLKASGDMTVIGSSVRTSNDISLIASGTLSISGEISTANGNVNLDAPTITLGSVLTAGGTRGVTLASRTGDTTANALTRAGGTVKQTVRVASIQNVALAGTITIDGVSLVNGDRVLLKNQTAASENGVYLYSAAGGGTLARATDADTAGELPPGFVVFVSEGTQTGGWTLLNPATPILGQTGLQFAPVTATRTYDEVKAATTASITLSGAQTVDGVALVAGDRVLVKNQGNAAQNGLYVVNTGAWQRAGDADTTAELTTGSFVFVRTGGAANGGKGFALTSDVVQVGTSPIAFADFFTTPSGSTSWSPARVLTDAAVATSVNILLTSLQTVDGVTLTGGERVLVKNQISASENGVYIAAAGAWSRATDADAVSGLPRSTAVYVTGGTQGQNTSWQFNDSTQLLGSTTSNSANVTNLVSTAGLTVGMLVTGSGIPGGTTIASLGANGTSLRLSQNATLTGSLTALSFTNTTAVVVGTDPVVFIPVGGSMTITAAKNIAGTSLLQGATALLTAGTSNAAASNLNTKTNFGRISATAPGPIVVTNSTSVELQNVSTSTAGGITVTADGTITALSVAATGTAGTPGTVALTSIYGDVVAESIASSLGNIGLTSINGDVAVTKARLAGANISASSGSITATADAAGAVITIDGRLNAAGAAGVGDISLLSNAGQLAFTGSANVVAADQLLISTPNSVPTIANGGQIAAARLDLTSQFGKGVNTPPAGLGTYQVVAINRTDVGDIVFTSASDLTVEGASTSDGSISFTAPNLSITGAILPQGPGADADVALSATAGNLFIDSTVTSQRDVTLSATGEVRKSSGGATALVTTPRDLTVNASNVANVLAKAAGFNSTMTAAGAALTVQDDDGLDIKSVTLSGGGTATFTIGSAGSGGDATIGKIDAGSTGTVTINAYGNIIEDTVDAGVADIIAGTANLNSTTGRIAVDTDVNILSAGVQQKNQNIVINDVGSTGLELKSVVGSNNANVNVTSKGTITATNVTTTGTISLTTTDLTADILVNQLSATANTITLSAGRSILEVTPGDANPDVTGSAVVLTAGTGSINVHLAASSVSATATTLGSSITLKDDDSLALTGITSNAGNAITISAGGDVTQTVGITGGGNLAVTNTAGSVILGRSDNEVATVSIVNPGRVVTYRDATGFGMGAAGVSGGAVTLTGNGNLTQTGLITATSLSVTDTAGSIDFDAVGNKIGSLSASNGGRPVIVRTATALDVTGIQAGATFLRVGGDLTQTLAINATSLDVTASAGAVTLDRSDNAVATFSGSNPGRSISFTDSTGFGIGSNGLNGGAVVLVGNGNLTQTGLITATSLSVTDTAGSVDFDVVGNKIGSLSASNGNRPVIVKTATALQVTGIQAGATFLRVGGDLTQTLAINATSLDVTASAGAVTLDRSDNAVATFSGSNPGQPISFTDSTGFNIGANGLNGGAVVLAGNGYLTQTGLINATSLSVTDTAGSIDFDLVGNKIGSLFASNGNRPVIIKTATALQVTGIQAGATFLRVGGDITQTAAINASSLDLTASAGAVTLTNAGNSVASLGVVSNPGGDVSFVNAGTFATTAITSGTAAVGDGNILLKSISGDINVNGNLTAVNDRVTLEARNGTFTLANGVVIDAQMLVYYVQTPPNFGTGTTIPSIIAANGDLTISQSGPITFGGYTTDGNITITGTSVTITGLLQTIGIGKTVAITATAGDIAFVGAGTIDNAPALTGTTTLSATGTVTALAGTKVSGATTTLTVGQAVTLPGTIDATNLAANGAGTAIDLSGSNTLGKVTVTKGSDVTIKDTTAGLTIDGIDATGTVTVTAAGAVDQTGAIVAGAFSVNGNGSAITLNTQANAVSSFAASNSTGSVLFNDTVGGLTLAGITGGTVTIGAAGAVDQTGVVNAGAFTVNGNGSAITLNTQANAVSSFAASNSTGSVLFNDTAGSLTLAGITGGTVTIGAAGAVDQTGAVNAGAFTVNGNGSAITLNTQKNTVTSFAASNSTGSVLFNDTAGSLTLAGITGGTVTIGAAGAVDQTGAVNAGAFTVNGNGSAITLNTQANAVTSFAASNSTGSVLFNDTAGSLTLAGITGGTVTIGAAGAIDQTAAIKASSLDVTASAGAVTLDRSDNVVATFSGSNPGRSISFTDSTGFGIGANGLSGGAVVLVGNGNLTQTGLITATSLSVTDTAGSVDFDVVGNKIGSLSASNGNRPVIVRTATTLQVTGIQAGATFLRVGGDLTQTAAIKASSLDVLGNGSSITLNTQANDVSSFAASNGAGSVLFNDTAGSLTLAGITGGTVTIGAAGAVDQTGAVNAGAFTVNGNGSAITLNTQANAVTSFAASNSTGSVLFNDTALGLTLAGITGGMVTIGATGAVDQTGAVIAGAFTVNGNGSAISLNTQANTVTSFAASNGAGSVLFNDTAGSLTLAGITGGTVTIGAAGAVDQSGAVNADAFTVNGNGSAITLNTQANAVSSFAASNSTGSVLFNDTVGGLTLAGITGGTVTIGAAGAVNQTGVVNAGAFTVNGNGSAISLNTKNNIVTSFAASNSTGDVLFNDTAGSLTLAGITGGTVTIGAAGAVDQTGAVNAGAFTVNGNGSAITLNTQANAVTSFAASNSTGSVLFNDTAGGLTLAGITGGTVTIGAAGAVDQSGVVNAGAFTVNGNGSAISLNTKNNTVTSFAANNSTGSVLFNDTAGSLTLAGITGGTVTIGAAGAVDQTGAVNAGAFTVNGNGSAITLDTKNNIVTSFAASNSTGSVFFNDTAGSLTLAGITGGTVTIGAAGAVDQSGAVNAGAFTVNGNGSAITLNTKNNIVTSFAASNSTGSVLFNDTAGGLTLAGITGGTVTIGAAGTVNQTSVVKAGSFTVNGNGGAVTLTQANVVDTFSANNGTGAVSFTDSVGSLSLGNITSGPLTIAAAGPVSINQTTVSASGNVAITTQAGGGLQIIGPQPGGLLQSSTQVNLSGVQGKIALINGGQIVAPSITGNGQNILVGGIGGKVTTTTELNSAVAAVNSLPAISGSTYEIVVAANIAVSQTLTFNRPVSLLGESANITLSGSPSVVNGLVVKTGASGSRISSLAFSGFSGNGIQLDAAQRVSLTGVTVTGTTAGTGAGLWINDNSTGTVVQGNVFTNNPFGIKIVSATGATIGGTLTGQRNSISGSARAGVFASGFCTGSSVIKTIFASTPVPYNIGSSRNLRVVQ